LSVRIRRLRLIGISRNYELSFVFEGKTRGLSIIAGEISTGKSSVLEFIDYCLGASSHPIHPEVQRQARSALLEVDLSGQIVVLERPLFTPHPAAFVHLCSLDEMDGPHGKVRRPLAPPGDPDSLSSLLLDHCGLAGISLKEAPSKADSATDPLSFRDLMWLCYLPNHRLADRQLLHEGSYMENLKLRQVIEVVFGVHDDQLAKLGDSVAAAREHGRALRAEIKSLEAFLQEQGIKTPDELRQQLQAISAETASVAARLEQLVQQMKASSTFADELRTEHSASQRRTAEVSTRVRDRDTLLRRLLPLRGQYAEDEKKLIFYGEARTLFDPLRVVVCPSCLQALPEAAAIKDGHCSLCGQDVIPSSETFDVSAELSALRLRKRELDKYVTEVEAQLVEARQQLIAAQGQEAELRSRVDAQVAQSLAPFVAEHDDLVGRREKLSASKSEAERTLSLFEGLERRRAEAAQVDERIVTLRARIQQLELERPSREALVSDLSQRFAGILEDFGFPKLFDPTPPFIDSHFTPHVRGVPYRDIGSSGAMTLSSLAWFIALYERVISTGAAHPGFIMIDGPQTHLTPTSENQLDEFADPAIVHRVWQRLETLGNQLNGAGQVIVVDNAPPPAVNPAVVVRYSGRPERPPYGLIDNETS
jgi:hypothetical protein